MNMSTRATLLAFLVLIIACGGSGDAPPTRDATAGRAGKEAPRVTVAPLQHLDMRQVVDAPGETVALVEQQLRAPYSGTLTRLRAVVGQHVEKGETLGAIVARNSEAALLGARQMMRDASTESEKADAQRALDLAHQNLNQARLTATARGVITAVATAEGDRVSENQDILTIVAASSVVFRAAVAQSDLKEIEPGRQAIVQLAGEHDPVPGIVKGLLGAADGADLTAPLRIDFQRSPRWIAPGLFGTATIEIVSRHGVLAAPRAAVLRDDLSGVERLALVGSEHKVHWVDVQTGLIDGDHVEIRSPQLDLDQPVIVSGQIGLPEGARVQESR
jgi:RND family efflux transporter MFP subunit